MRIGVSAAIATAVIYLSAPDILSPMQTLLFLITVFGACAYFIAFCFDQVERIQKKRRSLTIRKAKRRYEKVIDFPVRPRTKIIPAFKVRREA